MLRHERIALNLAGCGVGKRAGKIPLPVDSGNAYSVTKPYPSNVAPLELTRPAEP
jgi:hypothetical protein